VNDAVPGRSDSIGSELLAASLLTDGDFDLDEFTPPGTEVPSLDLHWLARGVEGDASYYSKYPVLPAVLAFPVFALSRVLAGPFEVVPGREKEADLRVARLGKIVGTLCTAAAAWVVFSIVMRASADAGRAMLAAVAFAFSSCAWFYGQALWTHPAGELFLGLGLLGALSLRARSEEPGLLAAGTGLALALAAAARYTNALPALWVVAGLLVALARSARGGGRDAAAAAAAMAIGALPVAIFQGAYNHAVFGSVFASSYGSELSGNTGMGFGGWKWDKPGEVAIMSLAYLTSTSFGLFVLSPIFVVAAAGLARAAVRDPIAAGAAAGIAATLLLHSLWWSAYHYSLGYRFLVDVLPLLALGFAFVPAPSLRLRPTTALWLLVFAAGVFFQVLAVARFRAYDHRWFDDLLVARGPAQFWSITDSVPAHLLRTPR
jgi:hypothetical protein